MRLEGMHHASMITGRAQGTIDFYVGVMGLRMVKKTVNFDDPGAYHLYFGDEQGAPGSILTWFEYPGAARGTAGAGMIHSLLLGVPDAGAIDFWQQRLEGLGVPTAREGDRLHLHDHDGLGLQLVVADPRNPPLRAVHPEVPGEFAITGVEGARAYPLGDVSADHDLLTRTLGFDEVAGGEYLVRGDERVFRWGYDPAPGQGRPGAGTVHHIAWHSRDEDHLAWRQRVHMAGEYVTPVIDRDYFDAIYFRPMQGILFEIATTSPGFAVDEPADRLGESLCLPAQYERLRPALDQRLAPLDARRPRAA
jgi:glyoxalase family protein